MGPCSAATSPRSAGASARQARETFSPRGATLSATDAQAGFALIEVLISAVMLALIVVATFTGFDVANRAERRRACARTGRCRRTAGRGSAAQLPDRPALGLTETRTARHGGYDLHLVSKGEFIADSTGCSSCMHRRRRSQLRADDLDCHLAGGRYAQPRRRDGSDRATRRRRAARAGHRRQGRPGVGHDVTATGPAPSASAVTGPAKGCVIFAASRRRRIQGHRARDRLHRQGRQAKRPNLTTPRSPGRPPKRRRLNSTSLVPSRRASNRRPGRKPRATRSWPRTHSAHSLVQELWNAWHIRNDRDLSHRTLSVR